MRFLWLLALTGCSASFARQLVQVTDEEGRPVAGAAVRGISPSITGPAELTNEDGIAAVSAPGSAWVSVSAAGYRSVQLDAPARWPLNVSLRREPSAVYEIVADIVRIGQLGSLDEGATVFATSDSDRRWFVELRVTTVVSGPSPAGEGKLLRYAVHSPTIFLRGRDSGSVRLRGRLLREESRSCHEVRLHVP